jgi:plastocyanin
MKIKSTLLSILIGLSALSALATNHIITFGNYFYSPASTTVAIGDTVTWQGDFAAHPLSTTAIPGGAQAIISVAIGTTYSYHVMVAGSYSYHCDAHYLQGMTGNFTATPVASVEEVALKPTLTFKLSTFGGVVRISDQGDNQSGVYKVRIGNILGESVYSGTMQAGETEKIIDIQDSPKGVYLLAISDENRQTYVRKFLIQ